MEENGNNDNAAQPQALPNNNNNEALYNAVAADDLAGLQQLLDEGADADTFYDDDHNISSKSILHIACGKGHTECVKALLRAGAMPDIHDKWGQTPLHYCVCAQFLDTAQALLEHLGDQTNQVINNQDSRGKTCLHGAAESASMEALGLLLKHGADVNVRNFDGVTPLMVCVESCARSKSIAALQLLVDNGALVNITDYRARRTALQKAAVVKNTSAVEYLLSVGAEVDCIDSTRRTPLTNIMWEHVRYRQGHCVVDTEVMTIIVLLVQAGADLDLAVCEYCNPLVTAAFLQAPILLSFFLDQGANPNVTFRSRVSPLLIATSKKDVECVRVLLDHNCSMTIKGLVFRKRLRPSTFDPFEMAVDDGSWELVRLFLAAGYQTSGPRCSSLITKLKEGVKAKTVSEDDYQWILGRVSSPASLRECCVFRIRQVLGMRLRTVVSQLPLPERVKDSVLLTHLLKR